MKSQTIVLLLLIFYSMLGLSAPRQSTQVADKEGRVTYESGPATPLSLVLAIGIGNSAPLGLVLGK